MKQSGRVAVLLVASATFLVLSFPALATESDDEATTPPPATAETEEGSSGLEPAVPIDDEAAEEVVPDWTYRYLVPTGLVLAVVVILLTSIRYFTDVVRRRYRIVEE